MRKIILIMQIAAFAICFSCSKKESVTASNTMEQKYFTQEGKAYVLKTTTKNLEGISLNVGSYSPQVWLNYPGSGGSGSLATEPATLAIDNQVKKVLPVMMTFMAAQGSIVQVNVASAYYSGYRYASGFGPVTMYSYIAGFSKMLPLVDEVYFTSNNAYQHNIRYGQAVLTENDFVDAAAGLGFYFCGNLSLAMTGNGGNSPVSPPVGNAYNTCVTFTYFELE